MVNEVRVTATPKRLLRTIIFLCMLAFVLWPSSSRTGDEDFLTMEETPYLVDKAYLGRGAEWVGDKVRLYRGHLPKLRRPHPGSLLAMPSPLAVSATVESRYDSRLEWPAYQSMLAAFARQSFPSKLGSWTVSVLHRWASTAPRPKAIPRQIWQTDKEAPATSSSYETLNPRSSYYFLDDGMVQSWLVQHFHPSAIEAAWDRITGLDRKSDFWKYLVLYLEGGFYSGTWAARGGSGLECS